LHETTNLPSYIEPKEKVYQDRNQKIDRIIAHFDGFDKEYFVSDHGKRAALLALRNGKVLLVRQYRLIINDLSYEIPGGKIDANETAEDAAIRECLEETGLECFHLKPLLNFHPSLDIWKNYTNIFFTDNFRQKPDDKSDRHILMPLKQCIEMIFSQKIVDSLSIIALLAYYIKINKS
tara:strand:- start:246 stop:779 length:534 start_codon:yes stop_codon:yes gene_type:complete